METYNFIISLGQVCFGLDINANSEDEAIDIVIKSYPPEAGWRYILI